MVLNPGSHPYHTMAQASVPYYGTRSVPYPRKGMVQTSVPYYGTSAVPYPTTSFSIPAAISRDIPSQSRAIPVPYLGHIDKCRAHAFPSREPYPYHTRTIPKGVQEYCRQDSPALKQQQILQSSRRLESQSSQEQDRTAQEQSRTAEELFHTFQYVQVWNKPPCHTLEQGPCHTLRRVWYKPSCHTVEQLLARGRALGKGIKIHCHICPTVSIIFLLFSFNKNARKP